MRRSSAAYNTLVGCFMLAVHFVPDIVAAAVQPSIASHVVPGSTTNLPTPVHFNSISDRARVARSFLAHGVEHRLNWFSPRGCQRSRRLSQLGHHLFGSTRARPLTSRRP